MGMTFKEKLFGGAAVAALGGKLYVIRKYRALTHGRRDPIESASNNRRVFARLPRRKQRDVIYNKRRQLREYEAITYGPYAMGRRRRRLWG